MTNLTLTGSALLHLRIAAFSQLYVALASGFEPVHAVVLGLIVAWVLARM